MNLKYSFSSRHHLLPTVRAEQVNLNRFELNLPDDRTLFPDPGNKSTWIHVVLANQSFTKDLYLRLFYQINSAIDKRNIQVVLVCRIQPPLGLIQLAYQFGETGTQSHSLFLELAYVF